MDCESKFFFTPIQNPLDECDCISQFDYESIFQHGLTNCGRPETIEFRDQERLIYDSSGKCFNEFFLMRQEIVNGLVVQQTGTLEKHPVDMDLCCLEFLDGSEHLRGSCTTEQ